LLFFDGAKIRKKIKLQKKNHFFSFFLKNPNPLQQVVNFFVVFCEFVVLLQKLKAIIICKKH